MKRLALMIGSAFWALGTGNALAQPFEYDCDTRSGSFSELKTVLSGTSHVVRGAVAAQRLYRHDKWQPTALMSLRSADGKEQIRVRAVADRPDQEEVEEGQIGFRVELVADGRKEEIDIGLVAIGAPIRFAISSSDEGGVVHVANVERKVQFKLHGNPIAMISCSTGEFLFTELEFSDH